MSIKILWVLVNCNTIKEAAIIGKKALRQRLTPCFNIFPRLATNYFWPPKTGKIKGLSPNALLSINVHNFEKIFYKIFEAI